MAQLSSPVAAPSTSRYHPRMAGGLAPTKVLRGVRTALAAGLLLPVAAALSARPRAQDQTGTITGQVVDGVTRKPVAGAVVSIGGPPLVGVPPERQPLKVLTGADGHFEFRQLGPGIFSITAEKSGYADGEPGRRRPGAPGEGVTIAAGPSSADVVVPMWRWSVIDGRVTDEAGEPVIDLQVRALRRGEYGQPFAIARETFTDDRGAYRFGDLAPGEYLVVASPPAISANVGIFEESARIGRSAGVLTALASDRGLTPGALVGGALVATGPGRAVPPAPVDGHVLVYPPTFYPSATVPAQASPITLGIGEERLGIDLQIAPVRTARVSGVVMGPDGPDPMRMLRLFPVGAEQIPSAVIAPTSVTDAAGAFTFACVASGSYTLIGDAGMNVAGWIGMPLTVSDDVDGLVAVVHPPLKVIARARFDGVGSPPAARFGTGFAVGLEGTDQTLTGLGIRAVNGENGVLTLVGYPPGRYRVRVVNSPQGWMFKGAMLNGIDVSETPFELRHDVTDLTLVFTDWFSGMNGRVDGAENAAVVVFPADAHLWTESGPNSRRFRKVHPDARGQFAATALPPGEYYAVAIADDQAADWRDPSTLERLARVATAVSIGEGETRTTNLRVQDIQ